MREQVHETIEPIRPEDIPEDVLAAAHAYDLGHRRDGDRGGSWTRVPDDQLRRLLAGALTEATEQIAQAVTAVCTDEVTGVVAPYGDLSAAVVRSWPEALDA